MYEAEHWHQDPRLQAPMIFFDGKHLYAGQFVLFYSFEEFEEYTGKVTRFVQRVRSNNL